MRDDTIIAYARHAPDYQKLEEHDWWVIVHHGLSVVWALLFVIFTAAVYGPILDGTVATLILAFMTTGSIAAIRGRVVFRHTTWELYGLVAVCSTWLGYIVLLVLQMVHLVSPTRVAVALLAVLAALRPTERLVFLVRRILKDARLIPDGLRIRRWRRKAPRADS